jgi:hypothetical protein
MSRPFPISSRLRLLPGFGFGIEFTHIRPELGNPNDQPASPYFAIDPVVRPELGLEHAWSHASLRLTVGLDIAMHGVQYVVTRQAQTELVRTPWRERPFVAITVSAPP